MARHKMKYGVCRLCGNETNLSFEHVPPRLAFNKTTKYISVPFENYIKEKDPLNNIPKGKLMQGGVGYNSLCADCNSFLGRNYVSLYQDWVQAGYQMLKVGAFEYAKFELLPQRPLFLLKQIISMFLSINDEWYLEEYPELAEFVKNPSLKELPDRYQIYTYLNNEGDIRYLKHSVAYSPELGKPVNCSEIAFPPFGYVLTIGYGMQINKLTNITGFKSYSENESVNLQLGIFKLPTYLPHPMDYRDKETIKKNIDEGRKITQENKD
ncbi:hypothetical protein [Marinifilum fragile]|uniref:hypothetical protein n=1 Tax=Marinifilum fragile TaxID=570161 RepID=UPI002AA7241B|nr:hypothetical protein [Marinifilum fragile]